MCVNLVKSTPFVGAWKRTLTYPSDSLCVECTIFNSVLAHGLQIQLKRNEKVNHAVSDPPSSQVNEICIPIELNPFVKSKGFQSLPPPPLSLSHVILRFRFYSESKPSSPSKSSSLSFLVSLRFVCCLWACLFFPSSSS